MGSRTLPPQRLRPRSVAAVEDQILEVFRQVVFEPLREHLMAAPALPRFLANAVEFGGLRRALQTGRIQYEGGEFTGELSAAIASDLRRIGAKFDKRKKSYILPELQAPQWVLVEASVYRLGAVQMHKDVDQALARIEETLDEALRLRQVRPEQTVKQVMDDFAKSSRLLEVKPDLGEQEVRRLSAEYTASLEPYIKDFCKAMIRDLREEVSENALHGYRAVGLVDLIKVRYAVARSKAQFLARQETGLFMASYRRIMFGKAGVTRYRWSTAHDERVRGDHKALDGRVFRYDAPPVTDQATGAKNNPGEDFNCRCVDIPILEAA